MSCFPLYDSLIEKITSQDIEIDDGVKDNFIKFIKDLDKENTELIYAVIKKYDIEHGNSNNLFPYGGKQLKSGYKFDFNNFPQDLQKILILFQKMNTQTFFNKN